MYILYLDESGVAESHSSQTSHYVLLGMAVHVGTWFALNKQVFGLKRAFALGDPGDLELHAAWIRRPYPEQQQIPDFEQLGWQARRDAVLQMREKREREVWPSLSGSKRQDDKRYYRSTDSLIHLTFSEREDLLNRSLGIVGNYRRGITLFAEAIHKSYLPPTADPVDQAFSQVVSRFEAFLRRRKNPEQWGMLVVDYDEHKAAGLTKMLHRFQRQGTPWGQVNHVIESPFFLDSSSNAGVQVTDLCAYALRRYLENGEEDRFRLIFNKFDRTGTGLHGLRHYTQPGCPCMICKERGHHQRPRASQ